MITRDTTIEEIFRQLPGANEILLKHGLDCVGCQIAEYETIGHAADVYGIKLEALLKELTEAEGQK